MASDISKILEDMRAGREIRFSDLYKVCHHYFGEPRNKGTSHHTFKTPWPGDPRVNIQPDKNRGKPYQVSQVLKAIDKFAAMAKQKVAKPSEKPPEKPEKPKKK